MAAFLSDSKVDDTNIVSPGPVTKIILGNFVTRYQFPEYQGRRKLFTGTGPQVHISKEEFLSFLGKALNEDTTFWRNGYMETCKHIFIKNPYSAEEITPESVPYTDAIKKEVRKSFEARIAAKKGEKAEKRVELTFIPRKKAFELGIVPECEWLDIIVYKSKKAGVDWEVVMIKAQPVNYELPMEVSTAKRNANGIEGGSGVALSDEDMKDAMKYWETHIRIR